MKAKKILVISMALILSINFFINVNALEIEKSERCQNDELREIENIDFDEDLMIDLSYDKSVSSLDLESQPNEKITSGDLDLAVKHLKAWYSPFPPVEGYEDYRYGCYCYSVRNIGDEYFGSGYIKINLYYVYADGENKYNKLDIEFEDINIRLNEMIQEWWLFGAVNSEFDCIGIRIEVLTDLPDSNPDNNVLYVDFQEGITVCGNVTEKGLFRKEKELVDIADITIDSEYDNSGFNYGFGTVQIYEHDWFTQVSPKNPDTPAYEYKLTAQISMFGKKQTKYTDPLEEMDYRDMYFNFIKIKSRDTIPFFLRILDNLPLFKQILNL